MLFKIQFETTPLWIEDDNLKVAFESYTGLESTTSTLVQWARTRYQEDTYGDYTTVACIWDQSSGSSYVMNWVGELSFADEDVQSQIWDGINAEELLAYDDARGYTLEGSAFELTQDDTSAAIGIMNC
jgi:hypothetical protein